jgi:hypothetical protein
MKLIEKTQVFFAILLYFNVFAQSEKISFSYTVSDISSIDAVSDTPQLPRICNSG